MAILTPIGGLASGGTYEGFLICSHDNNPLCTYAYHPQGALKTVFTDQDNRYLVGYTNYDAAGRMVNRGLDTAIPEIPLLKQYNSYYTWNIQGGRLNTLKTDYNPGDGNPVELRQDLRYTYDSFGNILTISDYISGSPQVQTFSYDAMERLETAQAAGGTDGNYSQETYSYDDVTGNLDSKAGISYTYSTQVSCTAGTRTIPHAVSTAIGSYGYDCNGNMTSRIVSGQTYNQTFDAENRLVAVSGAATANFKYDGDGNRIVGTVNGVTTVYIGAYEWTSNGSTKYLPGGGIRRTGYGANNGLYWILTDHLGSTTAVVRGYGVDPVVVTFEKTLYKPWGEQRGASQITLTSVGFTGQRKENALGLHYFRARWVDSALGRFISADSIVPNAGDPQSFDRYAFVRSNPVNRVDPTGHAETCAPEAGQGCGGGLAGIQAVISLVHQKKQDWNTLPSLYKDILVDNGFTPAA